MQRIRIATRKSPLALWQAEYVAGKIIQHYPETKIELVKMSTQGDRILDSPLAKIGGKGLFVKELENGLLQDDADIAVHSMKDVPVELPPGLHLSVIIQREDPRDVFVSNHYQNVEALPQGAKVGTSSLRRQCQLLHSRPDLQIESLRGNVNTRLKKLDDGEYDAILLAAAGMIRMGWQHRITATLSIDQSLPAIGQGAIGIECREDNTMINQMLHVLDHPETHQCILAERALNQTLEGGCQVPIAGHAMINHQEIAMKALVGKPDGTQIILCTAKGLVDDAASIGITLAQELIAKGAKAILNEITL